MSLLTAASLSASIPEKIQSQNKKIAEVKREVVSGKLDSVVHKLDPKCNR